MRTLRVTSGPLSGHSVEVERDLVIGRLAADLTIPDSELSRRHAVVRPVAGGVVIEDLGSLNGTFVGGDRIGDPVTLTRDATIRVGRSLIAVELDLPRASEPPAPATPDGRTRVAHAVPGSPPAPAPAPAPVTAVRPAPASLDDRPAPVTPPLAPAVTRVRPVPGRPATGRELPAVVPPPAVTRVRPVPTDLDPPSPVAAPAIAPAAPDLGEATPSLRAPPEDAAPEPARGLRLRLRGLLRRGPRR